MTTIDLTIDKSLRANAIKRAKEKNIIIPTYAEMKDPAKIPANVKDELKSIGLWDIHPRNLFRINWHNQPSASGGTFGGVNFLELPSSLTGVRARIVVIVGKWFSTGAHKVGAAFRTNSRPGLALPPPLAALLLQGAAFLASMACSALALHFGYTPSLISLAFLSGFIAALLSHLYGLARWWIPIQLLFLPTLVWALSFDLPPDWFLAAFLVLLVIYWSTFRTQVPLYLSSYKVWQALETLLPAPTPEKGFSFMDIGCGMGGVLAHLSKARPDGRFYGLETAPLPFLAS